MGHSVKWLNQYFGGTEWANRNLIDELGKLNNFDAISKNLDMEVMNLELQIREIQYITNFYVFDDEKFNKAWGYIVQELYMNGMVAIDKVKDDYIVYDFTLNKESQTREMLEGTVRLSIQNDEEYKTKEIKQGDMVMLRTNNYNIPWFMFSLHYHNDVIQALKSLRVNRINSVKRKLIKNNNINGTNNQSDIIKIAHSNMEDPIMVVNGGVNVGDIVDTGITNDEELIWDDLWNSVKWWEKMRGIRHNLSRKDNERNLTGELEQDEIQFKFIEREREKVIEDMVDQMKKIFNIELSYKTLIEIEDERQEEKMNKQQEQMKGNGEDKNEDNKDIQSKQY